MALKPSKLKPGTEAFQEFIDEHKADRCVTTEIHTLEWRTAEGNVVAVGVRPDYGKPYEISVVE